MDRNRKSAGPGNVGVGSSCMSNVSPDKRQHQIQPVVLQKTLEHVNTIFLLLIIIKFFCDMVSLQYIILEISKGTLE